MILIGVVIPIYSIAVAITAIFQSSRYQKGTLVKILAIIALIVYVIILFFLMPQLLSDELAYVLPFVVCLVYNMIALPIVLLVQPLKTGVGLTQTLNAAESIF
jgi:hypothetical protein